jgi:uncharacterized membrane protein
MIKLNKINKIPLILLFVSLIWTLLLFLTPLGLPQGKVVDLDGNANQIDYYDKWAKLPFPQNIVYTMGDLHCHQKYNRTFILNDNQMPVCTRDVGIFIGCNIGIILVFFVNSNLSPTRAFLNLFFKERTVEKIKHRKQWVAIILIICALPLIIDGLSQAFMTYESTTAIRMTTGLIFGIMFSFGVTVLATSIHNE